MRVTRSSIARSLGLGKSVSLADRAFRRSLLCVLLATCSLGVGSTVVNWPEIRLLLVDLFEHRSGLLALFFVGLCATAVFRLCWSLFFDVVPIKHVWGRFQEARFLHERSRFIRLALLLLFPIGTVLLFVRLPFREFINWPQLESGTTFGVVLFLFVTANLAKDILQTLMERTELTTRTSPLRLSQVPITRFATVKIDDPNDVWKPPAGVQSLLTSTRVNRALFKLSGNSGSAPLVNVSHRSFELPPRLHAVAESIFVEKQRLRARIYNESKIRLETDIDISLLDACLSGREAAVTLSRTSYYGTLCTNDAMRYRVHEEGKPSAPWEPWRDFMVRADLDANEEVLRPICMSELSNHIGGNMLVLRTDNRLVIQKQGIGALINPGGLVPTASGSLDYEDLALLDGSKGFLTLIVRGLLRELEEEYGANSPAIKFARLTGYTRDLERGGKPDFYGIAVVDAAYPRTSVTHEREFQDLFGEFEVTVDRGPAEFRNCAAMTALRNTSLGQTSYLLAALDCLCELPDEDLSLVLAQATGERFA